MLVESTCNQVNQFGGYTGMTPAAFVAYLHGLAAANAFPPDRLILGGDHLGPPWQNEPAASAMQKAADLVRAYVQAGYTKIHLDASMKLADDDPSRPLDLELSARRTAWLARVAEETPCEGFRTFARLTWFALCHRQRSPHPGRRQCARGRRQRDESGGCPPHARGHPDGFPAAGLGSAWERVIALVVQPGVEFGDDFVLDYDPAAAHPLAKALPKRSHSSTKPIPPITRPVPPCASSSVTISPS